jgi:addiction module HigA family antidote
MSTLLNPTEGSMAKSSPAGERKRPPSHPGAIAADILDDCRVSLRGAAKAIGLSPNGLGKVLRGESPVTVETALRFGAYFGNGAEFWLGLQQDHDLYRARVAMAAVLKTIEPLAR